MTDDDPITMAVMAAGTAAIGATTAVAGGMQAQGAASIQQQEDQRQAQLAKQQAGVEIGKEDTNAVADISKGIASAGASGATISGFAPMISEDEAQQTTKDMYLRFQGKLAASNAIYAGDYAKWKGNNAMWTGIWGGATNILGGAMKAGQDDPKLLSQLGISSAAALG